MEDLLGNEVGAVRAEVRAVDAGAAVKAVPVDYKVSRAAADVNCRHGYGGVVRAVGARQRSDEEIRIALVVLDNLVVEVDYLPADRLIPLNDDIREGRPVLVPALLGGEVDLEVIIGDPAHALPDEACGLPHAAAVGVNLLLRH